MPEEETGLMTPPVDDRAIADAFCDALNDQLERTMNSMAEAPNPIDLHVGARLRLRRKQLKLSQAALGNAIGVTFQQSQKYENGKNRISASTLYRCAEILDVQPNYFFDGFGGRSLTAGVAAPNITAEQVLTAVPEAAWILDFPRDQQLALGKIISAMAGNRKTAK
jgi:transcriptional regulator with XRE-family HTH domain